MTATIIATGSAALAVGLTVGLLVGMRNAQEYRPRLATVACEAGTGLAVDAVRSWMTNDDPADQPELVDE